MLLGESKLSLFKRERTQRRQLTFSQETLAETLVEDPELAWETPTALKTRWDELYKDVTEEEQVFPHEPRIRGGAGKA